MVPKLSLAVPGLTDGGPWCPIPAAGLWPQQILHRNHVNAVTQILPVADENNTRSSYRAARLRYANAEHLLHYVAAKNEEF